MPFAIGNDEKMAQWKTECKEAFEIRRGGTTQLSGRALLCAVTDNFRSHFNVEGNVATCALCHLALRATARPSDVVYFAAKGPKTPKLGMDIPKGCQLLLAFGIIEDESMLPSTYHGLNAPTWVKGRVGRPYTCEVVGAGPREKRDALDLLQSKLENPRVVAVAPSGSPANKYIVRLKCGAKLAYSSRKRQRCHFPGPIGLKKRRCDFKGNVLVMRRYCCWHANANNKKSMKPTP